MIKHPLGDMPVATFLAEYWQKKPLLIRHAFPDFESPLAADELAGLSCEPGVESRLIVRDADNESWDLLDGPFDDAVFADLPESHWTLMVQAVDHWIPAAGALLERFNFIPQWRVDDLMMSFATDGGGVGPHYDNYDVFLLQASGQRRWETGGFYNEDSAQQPDLPLKILLDWEAEQSWVLEPGDMLYLPPGIGHNGVAVGDGCITCSIGFRAPAHSEILQGYADFLSARLTGEQRYADPDLQLQDNPGEISPDALTYVHDILQQSLHDRSRLAEWFGTHVTESRYDDFKRNIESPWSEQGLLEYLATGGNLYRNEGSRLAFTELDQGLLLFADGEVFECDTALEMLVRSLCAQATFSAADDAPPSAQLELLVQLINQGTLYAEEPPEA